MNKKFSTLLVGAMLATVGVGSVSAAGVKLDKADGTYNTKLYQIAIGQNRDSVVVMTSRADGSDSLYVKARTTLGADSLANSLWCVAVTKPAQAGQSYIYDFRNKATGKKLAIDINPNWKHNQLMGDTLAVGVDLDGWAFSETAPQLSEKRPMYVYIPGKDSVAALGWDQTGARGGLEAMKVYAHADTIAKQVTSAGYVFTLMEPDHLTLNATALHTLLGRNSDGTSVQFHFWKGDTELKNTSAKEMVKGFVLGEELIAKDTTTARGTAGIIFRNKKTGNYLRVDSGWHNKDGVRFNVLTDTTTKVTFDLDNAAKHIGQYIFQVNYAPAGDSLYMRVDTAIYNNTFVEKDNFHRWTGEADSTYIVLQNLTANLAVTSGQLQTLMNKDIPQLTGKLNTIGDNFVLISNNLKEIDYATAMQSIDSTLANVKMITDKLNRKDNTVGLLLNDPSLYNNLNATTANAASLLEDLKSHPKRYVHFSLFGKKDK